MPCIRWPDKISNGDLWKAADQEPVATQIRGRKWAGSDLESTGEEEEGKTQGWIGHTLRKPASNITRQALTWNPQGERKSGRSMNIVSRDAEA